ncbi:MAG: DUF2330 domain-containing protein [Armatimonadota bacterium]
MPQEIVVTRMKRAVAIVVLSGLYAVASACCGVAPSGQPVKFGDQSNIIVWNSATKTEDFIRNAFFDSKAKDFGFIAATPVMPKLAEGNERAFNFLAGLKPPSIGCSGGIAAKKGSATAGSIDVLQQVDVGKYAATTVRSDDPAAMSAYLKSNGYASNPDTDEWIAFYTKKNWVFTAFKVREEPDGKSSTGVIKMTFKTDEPFNPYYVPGVNSGGNGILKLYFVSDGTYSATVGHSEGWNSALWDRQIPETKVSTLLAVLGMAETDLPKNLTVTYFEKHDWLEGAKDDLYFHRDSPVGKWALGGIVLLGAGLWWFTRTRRAKLA